MPEYVNVPDFLKIGVMATVFVWMLNKFAAKIHIVESTN